CPSGKGYVPCCSTGFSVAITRYGFGSACVTPSTVTWRSSIGSSKADCVRGVVRLISSTRTTLANTGPGTKRNAPVTWSKTLTPVRSEGRRSGVAWIRVKAPPIDVARARASVVFPTPGTPSSSRLPSANMQVAAVLTASSFPAMTLATFSVRSWKAAEASPKAGFGSIIVQTSTPLRKRLSGKVLGPLRSEGGDRLHHDPVREDRRDLGRVVRRRHLDDVHPCQLDRPHDLANGTEQLAREEAPGLRGPATRRHPGVDDVDVHGEVDP